MARLIDADALKETLDDLICESSNSAFQAGMIFILRDFIPKVIDEQLTIEAQPVRHGKWTDNGEDKYICSVCNCYVWRWFRKSDFCPHCGAKMDGGTEK